MKFLMERPNLPLYPLNDTDLEDSPVPPTYPDYNPWKDENPSETKGSGEKTHLSNPTYLNKGYFEAPVVLNEYFSARNLIQATIFLSTENCNNVLKELSLHLVAGYKARNEMINKIKFLLHSFKLPPRVTLSALKKESWLRDLASPLVPLLKVGEKIPHGMRNKVLIDAICTRQVPANRALWFTRSVLYGELIGLRRKHQKLHQQSIEKIESHWLQEWSQQVGDYLYKFSKEASQVLTPEKKQAYSSKLNYLLEYIQTLYIECLLDKNFFLSLVLRFMRDDFPLDASQVHEYLASANDDDDDATFPGVHVNIGMKLALFAVVKIFWKDILKLDYLCKDLSETLLLNHFFILHEQNTLPDLLREELLALISAQIVYLFKYDTNVFIIPNTWMLTHRSLYKILVDVGDENSTRKQLELIKYRNESLMLNMRHSTAKSAQHTEGDAAPRIDSSDIADVNRNSDDLLLLVSRLDKLKLTSEVATLLHPHTKGWRICLRLIVHWCITPYREWRDVHGNKYTEQESESSKASYKPSNLPVGCFSSCERILSVCNFIKRKVLQQKGAEAIQMEFENEVLDIIYNVADRNDPRINKHHLYVLFNELYQLKVITIATYLRKLIASGIFYRSPGTEGFSGDDPRVETHLDILKNLPVLNNKQCDSILRKWTAGGFNYVGQFEAGKETLATELVEYVMSNDRKKEPDLECVHRLNVGLKFLIVNWVTSELKRSIGESPKLVHITPIKLAHLYGFYARTDNLTVFFKVVIKFLLKNEGGMIIFYMDSLFLIANLVLMHFKLIKYIAGSSYDSVLTSYELFKLIVFNYKDLASRESDYFNFAKVWRCIDGAVERHITVKDDRKPFESFDLPMRIVTTTSKNESYSHAQFRQDLDYLLVRTPVDTDDIADFLLHTVDFSTSELQKETVAVLLSGLYVSFLSDPDNAYIKALSKLRAKMEREPFEAEVKSFIERRAHGEHQEWKDNVKKIKLKKKEDVDPMDEAADELELELNGILGADMSTEQTEEKYDMDPMEQLTGFIQYIALFEVLGMVDIVEAMGSGGDEMSKEAMFNLLFTSADILADQQILLDAIVQEYKERHGGHFARVVFIELRERQLIFESILMRKFAHETMEYIGELTTVSPRMVMDELVGHIAIDDTVSLLNMLLGIDPEEQITHMADFGKLPVNEFNLSLHQILLRVIVHRDLLGKPSSEARAELKQLVNKTLTNLSLEFDNVLDFYYGELFNYLTWEYRLMILDLLEDMFFTKVELSPDRIQSHYGSVDLLSVFNNFFKKFLAPNVATLNRNGNLLECMSSTLMQLLAVAQQTSCPTGTNYAISVFLRILIIHKTVLIRQILASDAELLFIKNLVYLLNSHYLVNENEKLHILLYDLLLILKADITDECSITNQSAQTQQSPDESKEERAEANTATDYNLATTDYNQQATHSLISSVFSLIEPKEQRQHELLSDEDVACSIMLDEEELHLGDYDWVNHTGLELVSTKNDLGNSFGMLGTTPENVPAARHEFKMHSFEILEDVSTGLNEGCINLHFFDAYTTKENPS